MTSVFDYLGCSHKEDASRDSLLVIFLHVLKEEHDYLSLPRGFEEEFDVYRSYGDS